MRASYSCVTSWKQLIAPTKAPSASRSGAMVTRATQRLPSGFWTTASAPSQLSPDMTARAMGVASGGMSSPARVVVPDGAAETRGRIEQARGPAPKFDGPPVCPQDLAVSIAGIDADRQRIQHRLVQIEQGIQERGL